MCVCVCVCVCVNDPSPALNFYKDSRARAMSSVDIHRKERGSQHCFKTESLQSIQIHKKSIARSSTLCASS